MAKFSLLWMLLCACERMPARTASEERPAPSVAAPVLTAPASRHDVAAANIPVEPECNGNCAHQHGHVHPVVAAIAPASAGDGSRVFGAPLSGAPEHALAALLAAPESLIGQKIRLEGTVARVCQRMGCWMELRSDSPDGVAQAVRVPMAGHAFFLPLDCQGQHATVEGTVAVAPLTDAMRAHLESEGAQNTRNLVSVDATTVVLHGT